MFWSWLQTVLDVMTVTYHLSYNVTSWFQPDRACLLFPAHFPSQKCRGGMAGPGWSVTRLSVESGHTEKLFWVWTLEQP